MDKRDLVLDFLLKKYPTLDKVADFLLKTPKDQFLELIAHIDLKQDDLDTSKNNLADIKADLQDPPK